MSALALSLLLAVAGPAGEIQDTTTAQAATWRIDKTHSEMTFRIRHLVSRVRGTFRDWEGTITADPADWAGGSVEVTIQAASIFTDNERRDTHLRSADFFDAETYPTLTFRSTKVEMDGEDLRLHGDLTIRGVSKPVVLEGEYLGLIPGERGDRIGFEVRTTIDRMDFGVSWNRAAEGGGVVLGDDVDIAIVVAAVKQQGS